MRLRSPGGRGMRPARPPAANRRSSRSRYRVQSVGGGGCWRYDMRPDAVAWSSLSPRRDDRRTASYMMRTGRAPPRRRGVGEVLQAADIHIAGGRQPFYPRVEDVRKMDVEGLIGTKCRKDASRHA